MSIHGSTSNLVSTIAIETNSSASEDFSALAIANVKQSNETQNILQRIKGETQLAKAIKQNDASYVRQKLSKKPELVSTLLHVKESKEKLPPLSVACRHAQLDVMSELIQAGADVSQTNHQGVSPLMSAVQSDSLDAVSLLLMHNPDINQRDNFNHNCSLSAAANGNLEILKKLVEYGVDIYNVNHMDNTNILMVAAKYGHLDIVRFSQAKGIDINQQTAITKMTALHFATRQGHTEVVEFLLTAGADPCLKDIGGHSPLFFAQQNGNGLIIQMLMEHEAKSSEEPSGHLEQDQQFIKAIQENDVSYIQQRLINEPESIATLLNQTSGKNVSPLMLAVQSNSLDTIDLLFKHNADINQKDKNGSNCGAICAVNGNLDTLKKLVAYGVDIHNTSSKQDIDIMMLASQHGHLDIIRFLHTRGIDVNRQTAISKVTALHFAAQYGHADVVEFLLQAGANPNLQNSYGFSPLFFAKQSGNSRAIQALIAYGATVSKPSTSTLSPTSKRIKNNEEKLLKAIKENDVSYIQQRLTQKPRAVSTLLAIKDVIGKHSPLAIAALYGRVEIMSELIQAGADVNQLSDGTGLSPFMFATHEGSLEAINVLINNHANIHQKDIDGFNCTATCAVKGKLDMLQKLVEYGININDASYVHGITALMLASKYGNLDIVRFLQTKGVDVNQKTTIDGMAALHFAAREDQADIVEFLLQAGANPNLKTSLGRTALSIAKQNGNDQTVQILLKHGVKDDKLAAIRSASLSFKPLKNKEEKFVKAIRENDTAYVQQRIMKKPELVKKTLGMLEFSDKQTPLAMAAYYGQVGIMYELLQAGADVNQPGDGEGLSPLMLAVKSGYLNAVNFLLNNNADINQKNKNGFNCSHTCAAKGNIDIFKKLFEYGVNINHASNTHHITALMIASKYGHLDIVRFLQEKGVDINKKTATDKIAPLHLAAREGQIEIVEFLLQAGANPDLKNRNGHTALSFAEKNGHQQIVEMIINYKRMNDNSWIFEPRPTRF